MKVGDKVRIVEVNDYFKMGEVVTLTKIEDDGIHEFKGEGGESWFLAQSRYVTTNDTPTLTIEPGKISEWPTTRDQELTSPYGDGNHPLPVTTGTLSELDVKAGDVVECLINSVGDEYNRENPFTIDYDLGAFNNTERYGYNDTCEYRLISRASHTPRTWAELTDEEQGKLLLAHHRGEVIEFWVNHSDYWTVINEPAWHDWAPYRVQPQPKPITTDVFCEVNGVKTVVGTINIIGDSVDLDSLDPH